MIPTHHSPVIAKKLKSKAGVPRGPKKILLVDDESIMAQTMDSALRRFGYNVFCFTNSLEALADFKLHPAQFDLIITDL